MMPPCSRAALALFVCAPFAPAQTCPTPVDTNTLVFGVSSEVENNKAYGTLDKREGFATDGVGGFYFVATRPDVGTELFRTDGTPGGTTLVADINPTGDSLPTELVSAVGRIYFLADNGTTGRDLWTTDGTAAGTIRLHDAQAATGKFAGLGALGSRAFFSVTDGGERELWTSDGTVAGTGLFMDINPTGSSHPVAFERGAGGTELYFRANDGAHGQELWRTDGTLAGTVLLIDAVPGTTGSTPDQIVTAGNLTYARAHLAGSDDALLVSDGTPAGTSIVKTFSSTGASPLDPPLELDYTVDHNGQLVFSAWTPTSGYELWSSDGTAAGTVQLGETAPGVSSGNPRPMASLGGKLLFTSNTWIFGASGHELYALDSVGTMQLVKEFVPGVGSGLHAPTGWVKVGGQLVFSAAQNGAWNLWMSDGTTAGTVKLHDFVATFNPNVHDVTKLDATHVLVTAHTDATGVEVHSVSATGVAVPLEVNAAVETESALPLGLVGVGNQRLFYHAELPGLGREPIMWSPSTGVVELGNIGIGSFSSFLYSTAPPTQFVRVGTGANERILFTPNSASGGSELWSTDGTAAGTQVFFEFYPGSSAGGGASSFVSMGGEAFFLAGSAAHPWGLWRTDGTTAGTQFVKAPTGTGAFAPAGGMRWGDRALLGVNDYGGGGSDPVTTFYLTDGTPGGTQEFAPLNLWDIALVEVVRDKLYFAARGNGATGHQLYVSDGTEAGTQQLTSDGPASFGNQPFALGVVDEVLYFTARESSNKWALKRTDGTQAGTFKLTDTYVSPAAFDKPAVTVGGRLFFQGKSQGGIAELWVSDGTVAGTFPVSQVVPGWSVAGASSLTAVGAGLVFVGSTPATGYELFYTDGLTTVQLVCDAMPGPASSSPFQVTLIDGLLVASMTLPGIGSELGVFDLGLGTVQPLDFGSPYGVEATAPTATAGVDFKTYGIPANAPSFLVWSLPVVTPSADFVQAGDLNWVDLASAQLAGVFAGGDWQAHRPVAADPSLVGLTVNAQVFVAENGTFPLASTGGLGLTIGS